MLNFHQVPSSITDKETGNSSSYVWIGDMYGGVGIANSEEKCNIKLPLIIDPLSKLVQQLRMTMWQSFPCILIMTLAIIVLHYGQMQDWLPFCPIPLAFGSSGIGKSIALKCALAMLGILCNHFNTELQRKDNQSMLQIWCAIGCWWPTVKGRYQQFIISLYNRAGVGTISRGKKVIKTSNYSSEFTTHDQQKWTILH